jgi:radical SAM superfamily enzyme YgiQ (UPF0313 family)
MKVDLINPRFQQNLWAFEDLRDFTGARFFSTPLGLATIAALTPNNWNARIIDENIEPIDFETDADLIAMGPFNVQFERAVAIAAEFRKRGKPVVFGGPYCSIAPEAFEGKADFRICGEAELTWPQFLRDFEMGTARSLYPSAVEKVNLATSPIPRYDLIRGDQYVLFYIQASRGCPFLCEFCDVIVVDGRAQRFKPIEQVLAELNHCVQQGARRVFFSDANFIGSISYARRLLQALTEYARKGGYPLEMSCELTINVADHDDLLELLHAANFTYVYIGIESPRRESLLETKKNQNARRDLVEDVKKIQSYQINVAVGMIAGFDSDDLLVFQEQYEFLQQLGTPFTTCGTLVAIPNTPLAKRMEAEGRMIHRDFFSVEGGGVSDTNFLPKNMTLEELATGYSWLLRCSYRYDTFSDRLVTLLSRFRPSPNPHRRARLTFKAGIVPMLRVLSYYLLTADRARFWFFIRTVWRATWVGPHTTWKWFELFQWLAMYPSLRSHVTKTQGVPESASPALPPFDTPTKQAPGEPDTKLGYMIGSLAGNTPRPD